MPKQYVPAVENGVHEALHEGILTHNPVVDVRVSLVDGKEHPVDSSEMAFKLAGSQALKAGAQKAQPVLLEPIVNVRVQTPEAYTGDLVSATSTASGRTCWASRRRSSVHGDRRPGAAGGDAALRTDLRSLTQGRATFEISFDHYEEVPEHVAKKVIEAAEKEKEKAAAAH